MILYLSSATEDRYFARLVKNGTICCGHQAQKFNSLVIRGLSEHTQVFAVSNPPYDLSKGFVESKKFCNDYLTFESIASNNSKLHKLDNFMQMNKIIKSAFKSHKIEAIVCDAINPLASLNAVLFSRKYKIPCIAIVTDIPQYMDAGRRSIFTTITEKLLEKYDGYVLLTEAMNTLVNPKNRPYIVMEGLCEITDGETTIEKKNEVFTCVYTGSLSEGTGIEELVKAVMLSENQSLKLKVYGNGKLAQMLDDAHKKDSRVEYCGVVTNAEAVKAQKAADLLINPRPDNIAYGHVSFPSKVMEYMASGTPLLTTRLPGIPSEYFEHLYVIEDCSVEGISNSINEVLSKTKDERENLGRSAKAFVLENKNNIKQTEKIFGLYKRISKYETK